MLRKPQAGDWAADDDDNDVEIAPIHMPQQSVAAAAVADRGSNSSSTRGGNSNSSSSRQEKSESEPPRNRWGRTPEEVQAGGRRGAGSDSRGDYSRSGSGYDRDVRRDGGYDRRDNYSSGGGYGGGRDYDRYGGGGGRDYDRRNDDRYGGYGGREPRRQHVETPLEQGIVVAIKESFGFVSCMDRDGDLFFHITEAPVDVQVHDEVEFRVRFNQRSGKEVASQLVLLPKGTIVLEDVSDELFDGVVTRGLRNQPSYSDARQQRDESHGLIELAKPAESKQESPVTDSAAATDSDAASDAKASGQFASRQQRSVVRFTLDSVSASQDAGTGESADAEQAAESTDSKSQPPRRKKLTAPAYGDEVRFRIATHRKSGAKRAVELVVTASAKAKLEKEIEAKLATMVRESGIVDKLKPGGGFIRCCDRPDDVYFPLHEIRASDDAAESTGGDAAGDGETKAPSSRKVKKPTLHEGDEVSFFVYEEREDESSRSRPRLTALRVQKLPKGSVAFETLVRSNVEGVVSKTPKEPRNGPEVIGSITPTADASAKADDASAGIREGSDDAAVKDSEMTAPTTTGESPQQTGKKASAKDAKKKSKSVAAAAVPFRLSDTHDASYLPGVGDTVVFDEVVEKRSGKRKAVNVRLVALNAKHRERGVITSLRDDFGFIKCADRAMDAYFRFSDVMVSSQRDFRLGTEVAFDVSVDPTKGDNARATRVELLPAGSVQWETVIAGTVAGEVIAVPGNTSRGGSAGGRGGGKGSLKTAQGRIRLAATSGTKFWLDYLPELKQKIDSKFVTAAGSADESTAAADGASESDKTKKKELRLLFPASLSNAERFVIHQYCDALGIQHQSSGDGASRRLELVAGHKVPALTSTALDALPALELEFKAEDVAEVRYSPRVGDRVTFTLAQATRTKQLMCKSVVCVESVSGATVPTTKSGGSKKNDKDAAPAARGEGFIVLVRSEGFGFIQPVNAPAGSMDENLFFHIKEVTTGETLEELKTGMEVQYTPTFDDVKKKTRAVQIAVVPAGTIKKPEVVVLRGVVTRPSLLQPLKGKNARFVKSSGKAPGMSTVGKIRAVAGDTAAASDSSGDKDDAGGEGDDAEGDDAEGEDAEAADNETAGTAADSESAETDLKKPATKAAKKAKVKAASTLFAYTIKDIVDPSVVLREGDEVEFTVVASAKGPRASKIRVVALHAKQGVVTKVHEDLGGVIRVDSDAADAPVLEIPFAARHVLRGDVLSEGDRVEFAHSMAPPSATRTIGTAATAVAKAETAVETEPDEAVAETKPQQESEQPESFVGQATSVLRLSAAPVGVSIETRARAPRTVNSSLLQAMRQVGASAVVASRMAKGPDGTRGFKEGWRAELLAETSADGAATAPVSLSE